MGKMRILVARGTVVAATWGAILCGGAESALAWGADGHKAVAAIAAQFIAPATAAEVRSLLGGWGSAEDQMVTASVWADETRMFHPETAHLHFINIPLRAAGADMGRDCPGGECIVAALDHYADVLRERRLSAAVRGEALRYLIHFAGDVAQPLHASDNNDHGGNSLFVRVGGVSGSLHHFWDTELVEAVEERAGVRGGKALGVSLAARISVQQRRQWATGTPLSWANESHDLAGRVAYAGIGGRGGNSAREPVLLGSEYMAQAVPVVEGQLAVAGVRLAAELDMLLGR